MPSCCGCGVQAGSCSSDWTPSLGISTCPECGPKKAKNKYIHTIKQDHGVAIVAQQLTNQTSILEDAGSISGLPQWVKDLALPRAVVSLADVAWILCCCGCGVGQQLQTQYQPWPRNFHVPRVWP